jgi:hypothetical protein
VDLTGKNEIPVPEENETRLIAELNKSHQLYVAAWEDLARPAHSVIHNGEVHRKLLEAQAAARLRYVAVKAALWAWRASRRAEQNN